MSGGLRWFRVRWPRHVDAEQLVGATAALAAVRKPPIVLEAVGVAGRVEHRIGVPEPTVGFVRRQLTSALTGVGLELLESRPVPDAAGDCGDQYCRRLPTPPAMNAARLVLSALAVRTDEVVVLQWAWRRALPAAVAARPGVLLSRGPHDRRGVECRCRAARADARMALRAKRASHGWRAAAGWRCASAARERQPLAHVMARRAAWKHRTCRSRCATQRPLSPASGVALSAACQPCRACAAGGVAGRRYRCSAGVGDAPLMLLVPKAILPGP